MTGGKARPPIGEPGIRITIIPGAIAGEMAKLVTAAGWDMKPSGAAAADLEAALKAGAAGRLVLFVSPGSRVPTFLTHVLVPHDGTPATSAVLATVGGAALWSHAEIVMLHVAAAELPSEPGSLPAPRMIDHDGHDWSDWREEFGRRFSRVSSGMPVRVELATGVREESILRVARQLPADLLILAWSGVLEANRAPTARSVCAVAPCPVLLVAGRGRSSIGRSLDAAGTWQDACSFGARRLLNLPALLGRRLLAKMLTAFGPGWRRSRTEREPTCVCHSPESRGLLARAVSQSPLRQPTPNKQVSRKGGPLRSF